MVRQQNDGGDVKRQLKKNQNLKNCDSPDTTAKSDNENISDRPCLIQIPGKQTIENEDVHVSSEAQENYANNRNAENQLRVSQGSKPSSGLKNETFKRINTSNNNALLKRTETNKSGKKYGFDLDLPDSLRADKSNLNTDFAEAPPVQKEVEKSELKKIEISKKPENSDLKPNDMSLKQLKLKHSVNTPIEVGMHSAFLKRVSLGMSALACLTIAMWWGQYKQVNGGEGILAPQVAMIKAAKQTDYRVVSEKVKKIGNSSVVFVDFELGTSKLDLDQIYAELDRRIIRSKTNHSFRFRFFMSNEKNHPYFDLFAGIKPNKKLIEQFQNREEYRGLSVLWNATGNIGESTR